MDNENNELELESQETVTETDGIEFDPTESEEFYNNLEAAINAEDSNVPESEPVPAPDFEPIMAADKNFEEECMSEEKEAYSAAEEDLFAGVDAALSEQIEQEFGKDVHASSAEDKEPNRFLAVLKEIPTWTKVLVSVILVILLSVGLLFGTPGGRKLMIKVVVGGFFEKIEEDPIDKITITPGPTEVVVTLTTAPEPTMDPGQNPDTTPEPTIEGQNPEQSPSPTPELTGEPTATPEPTPTPKPVVKLMDDENIINVLLVGVENIYGATYGRTDAMILVSVNLEGGPLKMVSFQRDLYVDIPGYEDDDRLNAAFAYRGPNLLIDTIEQNFGIDVDSYVKVNFEGFEDIIDRLGGLEISLTAKESEYLNTTKYISKKSERNTVAGKQTMTGSQVLGYCRVRYVPTENGLRDDRGRNYRHRVVLQAIFDKYKSKSITELFSIMNECFNYVSAPANLEDLAIECLSAVIENKMFEIETMQMPQSGNYSEVTIANKQVISYHPEAVDELQDFLYGE